MKFFEYKLANDLISKFFWDITRAWKRSPEDPKIICRKHGNGAEHQVGKSRSWHPKEANEGSEDKRMGDKRSRLTDVRKGKGVTRAEALGVACLSFPPM